MKKKVFGKIAKNLLLGLMLFAIAANVFILFPKPAQAVPPRMDWKEAWPNGFHCEAGLEDHCTPKSALSY
jgi:hypothetical protein